MVHLTVYCGDCRCIIIELIAPNGIATPLIQLLSWMATGIHIQDHQFKFPMKQDMKLGISVAPTIIHPFSDDLLKMPPNRGN